MKLTASQLRKIIKEEVQSVLRESQLAPGTRATYSHPSFPRLGQVMGTIEDNYGELVFMPDEEFHDMVYKVTGQEPLEGLFLDGGAMVTPA